MSVFGLLVLVFVLRNLALRMFGLRAMFFVIQDLVQLFELLKYGLPLGLRQPHAGGLGGVGWVARGRGLRGVRGGVNLG